MRKPRVGQYMAGERNCRWTSTLVLDCVHKPEMSEAAVVEPALSQGAIESQEGPDSMTGHMMATQLWAAMFDEYVVDADE